jgi:HK97 family phage prohead protease
VSTNKADRHGDIVTPESFKKRLKYYKEHPVLLSSHDYYDLRKQIGEATKLSVTDTGLEATFKYYADLGNPEADWAWVLAQKRIAAFSIGFMNHEFEWIKEKDKEGNETITGRKFLDIELLEVSQVLIPANRQSIQERNDYAAESGRLAEMAVKAMDSGDIKEIAIPEAKKEEKTPPEAPVEAQEAKNTDRSHYSENVLGDGPEEEATRRSNKEALEGAVKEAVKTAFQ